MDIEIKTYFEEDVKEYAYCDMIALLIKRLKKATGINLLKLDRADAVEILRAMITDFAELALQQDDDGDPRWLNLAMDEIY